jgi:hypothetical protein
LTDSGPQPPAAPHAPQAPAAPQTSPAPAAAGQPAAPPSAGQEALRTAPEAKWPCLPCGESVPLSLDACPSCGGGFLAGSTTAPAVKLPGVGDITTLSRTQRLMVGLGIAVVVMLVLVLIATIGGHLF